MSGYLLVHPDMRWVVAGVALLVVAVVVGGLLDWFVLEAGWWPLVGRKWRTARREARYRADLPGPVSVSATGQAHRAGEPYWYDDGTGCPDDFPDGTCMHCGAGRREPHRDDCPVHRDWDELDPDAQADQLIAEWHDCHWPDCADSGACDYRGHQCGLTNLPGRLPGDPRHPAGDHLEPWPEHAWQDDPDLVVWDAKQQAARCWEILHVEFPRLRASLGIAA